MRFFLACCLLVLASCSLFEKKPEPSAYPEVPLTHRAVIDQRLIPRKGYEGFLTNQICTHFEGKKCLAKDVKTYDLKDEAVRKQLVVDLKFACRLGTKRFRISLTKVGFERQEGGCVEWKKRPITRKTYCSKAGVTKSEFIDGITEYQRLIDGALECRSGI